MVHRYIHNSVEFPSSIAAYIWEVLYDGILPRRSLSDMW
jgi:hypothetical protein